MIYRYVHDRYTTTPKPEIIFQPKLSTNVYLKNSFHGYTNKTNSKTGTNALV